MGPRSENEPPPAVIRPQKRRSRRKSRDRRFFIWDSDQHRTSARDCSKRASAFFQSMKENQ